MISVLLTLSLTSPAAPVPKEAAATPTGPAPYVVRLTSDGNGDLSVIVTKMTKMKVSSAVARVENGVTKTEVTEQEVQRPIRSVEKLTDTDTKIATVDGTELKLAGLAQRAKSGLTVLISADGKPVDKAWLRGVADDTVLISGKAFEGTTQIMALSNGQVPSTPAPRLVILGVDMDGKVNVPMATAPGIGAGASSPSTGTIMRVRPIALPPNGGAAVPAPAPVPNGAAPIQKVAPPVPAAPGVSTPAIAPAEAPARGVAPAPALPPAATPAPAAPAPAPPADATPAAPPAGGAAGAPPAVGGVRNHLRRAPVPVADPTDDTNPADKMKTLESLKFEAYTVDGKAVEREEALKRLKSGGTVLIAGDNRFPDKDFLKPFPADMLVIVSEELGNPNQFMNPGRPIFRGGPVRIQPAPAPGRAVPLPAPAPAGPNQVQVLPAQVLPAGPAVRPGVRPAPPAQRDDN